MTLFLHLQLLCTTIAMLNFYSGLSFFMYTEYIYELLLYGFIGFPCL